MVILPLYKELKLDGILTLHVFHHFLMSLLHKHQLKRLRLHDQLQPMVQYNMARIFHSLLDLGIQSLLLILSYELLSRNLCDLQLPIILPIRMGNDIQYLMFRYYNDLILLVNVHVDGCALGSFLSLLANSSNILSRIHTT